MALVNTATAMEQPWINKYNEQTPRRVDLIQTAGSGATSGGLEIFADATAANDFFLMSIDISFLAPTATAVFSLYGGKTVIATYPTLGAAAPAQYHHSYPLGLNVGETTDTATVAVFGDGVSTATVQFVATGMRKK